MDLKAIQLKLDGIVQTLGGNVQAIVVATVAVAGVVTLLIVKLCFSTKSMKNNSLPVAKRDLKKKNKEKIDPVAAPTVPVPEKKTKDTKPAKKADTTQKKAKTAISLKQMMAMSVDDEFNQKEEDVGEFIMIKNGKKVKAEQPAPKAKKVAQPPRIATAIGEDATGPKQSAPAPKEKPKQKPNQKKTNHASTPKQDPITPEQVASFFESPAPVEKVRAPPSDEWKTVPVKSKKTKARKD